MAGRTESKIRSPSIVRLAKSLVFDFAISVIKFAALNLYLS
jgi:hypothetical protein